MRIQLAQTSANADLSGIRRFIRSGSVMGIALIGLTACFGAEPNPKPADEGIGFRQQRFEQISALREFRGCRDQALGMDEQARRNADPAQYIASARLLEKCETNLGPAAKGVPLNERMQAYAVSIQNYVKGGDMKSARENLSHFRTAFAGQDLYYADGTSFTDTMAVLVGEYDVQTATDLSMVNAKRELKSEVRRAQFWGRN